MLWYCIWFGWHLLAFISSSLFNPQGLEVTVGQPNVWIVRPETQSKSTKLRISIPQTTGQALTVQQSWAESHTPSAIILITWLTSTYQSYGNHDHGLYELRMASFILSEVSSNMWFFLLHEPSSVRIPDNIPLFENKVLCCFVTSCTPHHPHLCLVMDDVSVHRHLGVPISIHRPQAIPAEGHMLPRKWTVSKRSSACSIQDLASDTFDGLH